MRILIAIVAMVLSSAAVAQGWVSGRTTTTDTKIAYCTMESEQGGHWARFHRYADDAKYYVHVYGPTLRTEVRSRQSLSIGIDAGAVFTLAAQGAAGSEGGVLADLGAADFDRLLASVAAGNRMRLGFPTLGAADLSFSLTGTGVAADALRRCVAGLN